MIIRRMSSAYRIHSIEKVLRSNSFVASPLHFPHPTYNLAAGPTDVISLYSKDVKKSLNPSPVISPAKY